jgi:hypothetical protein
MVKFSEVKKLLKRRSMSLNGVKFVVLKQLLFTIDVTFCIQIETFENTRLFLVIFNF